MDIIQVKAGLLCLGVRYDDAAMRLYQEQNPFWPRKTGNVGLHLLLNDETPVIASTTHNFNRRSPYKLVQVNDDWKLYKQGKKVCDVSPIPTPKWYDKITDDGTPMPGVFLHEGLHYLHQVYAGCGYFLIGEQCKFCGTGKNWKIISPRNFGQVAKEAYLENSEYHVCLGGGTRLGRDKGAFYFLKCIKAIRREVPKIPIWVEMVPPDEDKYLQMLIDAGADSFGINLEIWNDDLRREICPGKSKITKERYFESWEYILSELGNDKTGSVLIAGLEPVKSTLEGAQEIAKMGVRPCIRAFTPWNGSAYKKMSSASPSDLVFIGKKVSIFMKEYGINPKDNHGCMNCPSCTVECDYLFSSSL